MQVEAIYKVYKRNVGECIRVAPKLYFDLRSGKLTQGRVGLEEI